MKKFVVIICAIFTMMIFAGCNKQVFDTTYKYDYGIIKLANGEVVEGKIESWDDYEGEQLQVKIGGKIYLVHSANANLIAE